MPLRLPCEAPAIAPPAAAPMMALRALLLEDPPDPDARPRAPPTTAPAGTALEFRSTSRAAVTVPYWIVTLWPARCAHAGVVATPNNAAVAAAVNAMYFISFLLYCAWSSVPG